jgi:6,7-dimethyl-8-ribityllumazine synthase
MSGNAPKIVLPQLPQVRVAIISSSWHVDICNDLIAGAKRALQSAGITDITTTHVPGSFEIPLAAQFAFEEGCDAVVAVGLVLKGDTPHFDYVCQGVTQGVLDVSLKFSRPIGFGVLMCDSLDQAIARCGRPESVEDKGFDSAVAAIKLLELKKD